MTNHAHGCEEAIPEHLLNLQEDDRAVRAKTLSIIDASAKTTKAAACLKKSGIETVIRYYCRDPAGSWKTLSREEAENLIVTQKIRLAIVFENNAKPNSFSYASGLLDGEFACAFALGTIGQPKGSAIYFAVDFDYLPGSSILRKRILPYFQAVGDAVKAAGSPYRIGVYGSGLTCKALLDEDLVELAWLAQSTGWTGYKDFKASKRWALLQHAETALCKIPVDYDEPNPSIPDFGSFGELMPADALIAVGDDEDLEHLRASSALDDLDPDLKARVLVLLKKCLSRNVKMVPYFGIRDPLTQAKLWRQSRTEAQAEAAAKKLEKNGAPFLAGVLRKAEAPAGKHVTNALPGLSWHQWGEALDCYWEVNGKPVWDPDKQVGGVRGYHVYADTAETEEVGLFAGGHWSSFQDWPHVQLRSTAGPQNVYSYAFIDKTMKERFGEMIDIDEVGLTAGGFQGDSPAANLTEVFADALMALRDASNTTLDGKPYLFPNGIFKIDLALGILGDPPSEQPPATPVISARVTVSGIDKT